jgi:hypothetical protein
MTVVLSSVAAHAARLRARDQIRKALGCRKAQVPKVKVCSDVKKSIWKQCLMLLNIQASIHSKYPHLQCSMSVNIWTGWLLT